MELCDCATPQEGTGGADVLLNGQCAPQTAHRAAPVWAPVRRIATDRYRVSIRRRPVARVAAFRYRQVDSGSRSNRMSEVRVAGRLLPWLLTPKIALTANDGRNCPGRPLRFPGIETRQQRIQEPLSARIPSRRPSMNRDSSTQSSAASLGGADRAMLPSSR